MSVLWSLSSPASHFVVRGVVVYAAVLLLLRISGKKQVGQMGAGDFVALLLLSNAVQNSMNGGDNSITGGLILAVVIMALSRLVTWLTYKSKTLENVFDGVPRLLVHHGKLIEANMESELVSVHELRTRLRRQGVYKLEDVHQAVLEADGSLSVIKKDELPA